MKRILFLAALLVMFVASAHCYDQYHVGFSSGIPVSSTTFTNAICIKAGSVYPVNIDGIKLSCDGDATVDIAISSNITAGYNGVVATVKPIGVATENQFTVKAAVTATQLYIGTTFRLPANHTLNMDEYVGKISIPVNYGLLIRFQADTENKKAFGLLRVWE